MASRMSDNTGCPTAASRRLTSWYLPSVTVRRTSPFSSTSSRAGRAVKSERATPAARVSASEASGVPSTRAM